MTVLDAALAQLPVPASKVIARTDSAGLSHGFLDACRERQVRFVVGHRLTAELAAVVAGLADRCWGPAVTADGSDEREGAEVTELVDLSGWPPATATASS